MYLCLPIRILQNAAHRTIKDVAVCAVGYRVLRRIDLRIGNNKPDTPALATGFRMASACAVAGSTRIDSVQAGSSLRSSWLSGKKCVWMTFQPRERGWAHCPASRQYEGQVPATHKRARNESSRRDNNSTWTCLSCNARKSACPLKEVIHPHLPVRVPCYDLVPLTPRTFGRSFPCGLGHGLRVQTIQVT